MLYSTYEKEKKFNITFNNSIIVMSLGTIKDQVHAAIDQGTTPTEAEVEDEVIARINYIPGYSIAVWNNYGPDRQLTGQKLKHGTTWQFFKKVIDSSGNSWHQVGAQQWISGDYVKVSNTRFDFTAAKSWDPNYASLEITKNSSINLNYASKYQAINQVIAVAKQQIGKG